MPHGRNSGSRRALYHAFAPHQHQSVESTHCLTSAAHNDPASLTRWRCPTMMYIAPDISVVHSRHILYERPINTNAKRIPLYIFITSGHEKPHSDLNHFEIFLARPAFRACPVNRHVFPAGAWRNPFFRQTRLFVVHPAANQAHPTFIFHLSLR